MNDSLAPTGMSQEVSHNSTYFTSVCLSISLPVLILHLSKYINRYTNKNLCLLDKKAFKIRLIIIINATSSISFPKVKLMYRFIISSENKNSLLLKNAPKDESSHYSRSRKR